MFGLKWALITLIIILVLIGALLGPMQDAMKELARTNARMHALEIAGIINLLQSAPDKTTHVYVLPAMECTLKIDNSVNFTSTDGGSYIASLIMDVRTSPFSTECELDREKPINFEKDKVIRVYE